jgi:hypothetical protein
MVKANELRIGNILIEYYSINDEPAQRYFTIKTGEDIDCVDEGFEPIPLTPEILEKCGFNWSIYHQAFHKHDDEHKIYDINECHPNGFQFSTFKKNQLIGVPFYYLHQLQNLYMCLSGEELEVNL